MTRLDERIAATKAAIVAHKYTDVGEIVEASRLELRRAAGQSGVDDASSPALLDAQRAVAVDSQDPRARLALAMALTPTLLDRKAPVDAAQARLQLRLVAMAAGPAARADRQRHRFTVAAAKTLLGYVALESGDVDEARAQFTAALQLQPDLTSAWVGTGDVRRATSDFEGATAAYQGALARAPDDAAIRAALDATSRHEAYSLSTLPMVDATEALDDAPLAPPPTPVEPCPARVRGQRVNADLCAGLDALLAAKTDLDEKRAADRIIEGYQTLHPLCQARDPACGPHVAAALVAAMHSYVQVGLAAKGIATGGMLLLRLASLPNSGRWTSEAHFAIADAFYSLAVFHMAAQHYDLVTPVPARPRATDGMVRVARRALALRAALHDRAALDQIAPGHRPAKPCHRFVNCAVERLAGEKGWSP